MAPLRFEEADSSSIGDLQRFECTTRPVFDGHRRKAHPEPWALEAQSLLRALQPPLKGYNKLILAYDEDGLAGACRYDLDTPSRIEPVFHIEALACATRCQRTGIGKELLEYVLDVIAVSNYRDGTDWGVTTFIHNQNEPSRRLAASLGFSSITDEGDEYELWALQRVTLVS